MVGALLERLDELCALAGQDLQVFLGLVRQFGELDADAVALAVAHDTDSADLGVLDVDSELKARTGGQVACGLDEAATQADVGAHAPARGPTESGLDTRNS